MDNAATTQPCPEAVSAMLTVLQMDYGNPSVFMQKAIQFGTSWKKHALMLQILLERVQQSRSFSLLARQNPLRLPLLQSA